MKSFKALAVAALVSIAAVGCGGDPEIKAADARFQTEEGKEFLRMTCADYKNLQDKTGWSAEYISNYMHEEAGSLKFKDLQERYMRDICPSIFAN